MKKNILTFFLTVSSVICFGASRPIKVSSPDGRLHATVEVGQKVSMRVESDAKPLFAADRLSLNTSAGTVPAQGATVVRVKQSRVDRVVVPEIREKRAKINEQYNESVIEFNDRSKLLLRAYNDGVAYRWVSSFPGEILIENEVLDLRFDPSDSLIYQQDKASGGSAEKPYITSRMGQLNDETMGNLPALIQKEDGRCVVWMESDVVSFPALWLKKGETGLNAHHWPCAKTLKNSGNYYNFKAVASTEEYVAKVEGTRSYPWRIFAVGQTEAELLTNQMVYLLAPSCKLNDVSWIKPGWVAFDWWARSAIYGEKFAGGVNTETANYLIDFASNYGMRYFLFDDGWTIDNDLTRFIPQVDIREVVNHATKRGVDVLLWVSFALFDDQMEEACKKFSEWGVKGVKIDFIDRNDQQAVDFLRRAAETCARHKLVIDFHGCITPNGLRREYPNVLTREGLIEIEYNCWSSDDNPRHHCLVPFIRNVAGPVDHISFTTNNASKAEYKPIGTRPVGQGSRAHAMALAVIDESPMQMLPDGPSDYYREDECTRFVTQIPTEWNELVPLQARLGQYVALARQCDGAWYVAAITDWTPRSMELSFDFLPSGRDFKVELFRDGPNSGIRAIDYVREVKTVRKGDRWTVDLASGGGWVARIF